MTLRPSQRPKPYPFGFIDRRCKQLASIFAARCFWAEFEDLYQQAWNIALDALENYDPSRLGPERTSLGGYLWNAITFGLQAYLWRESAPVSGQKLDGLRRADVEELDAAATLALLEPAGSLEEMLTRARREQEVWGTVQRLVEQRPDLALGFAPFVEEAPPREVAAAAQVERREVYQAQARVKRAVEKDDGLWLIWMEL